MEVVVPDVAPLTGAELVDLVQVQRIDLRSPTEEARAAWRRTFHDATSNGLAPDGSKLRLKGRDSGDLSIWLERQQETAASVAVPKTLRKPHVVVQAIIDSPTKFEMRTAVVRRAALITQGLVDAMTGRGWTVGLPTARRTAAVVEWSSHHVELNIKEMQTRTAHILTAREIADRKKYPSSYIPEYDSTPDGRLQIVVIGPYTRKKFADAKRIKLDDRLGVVIDEIKRLFEEAEQRRVKHEHEEQLRQDRRQDALARAAVLHEEAERTSVMWAEIGAWQQVAQMRKYADQLEERFGDESAEWVEWIRRKADAIDPLELESHGVPDIASAGPSELAKYMPGVINSWV